MRRIDKRLRKAVSKGQLDDVRRYLQEGANPNAVPAFLGKVRGPSLYCATERGFKEIAELLIQNGADVNSKVFEQSILFLAVEKDNTDMAEMLIRNGAKIYSKDFDPKWDCYETPWYLATKRNRPDMVELFRKYGAVHGYYDGPPPARVIEGTRLAGIVIVFSQDFEPKDTFVNSILTKMTARNRSYKEWMTKETPIRVIINPAAQDPLAIMANAMVQFRMMGIEFDADNVEHATFEGSHGISGAIITHWSSKR